MSTLGEQRQRYNEEFKKQTVKYIQEQTKTISDICEEMGIAKSTIHQWIGKYRQFEDEPIASTEKVHQLEQQLKVQEKETKKIEREKAELQEELAILKKALHIFSKEKN